MSDAPPLSTIISNEYDLTQDILTHESTKLQRVMQASDYNYTPRDLPVEQNVRIPGAMRMPEARSFVWPIFHRPMDDLLQ
jgi:hypothetical protein